jgi:hypothetical protein
MSKNENENKNETTNGRASAPARVASQRTGQPEQQTVADRLPTLDQARVDALLTPEVMGRYAIMLRDYAAKSPGYPHWCDHGYGVQILSEDTVRVCAVVDAEHSLCCVQEWVTVLGALGITVQLDPYTVLIPWGVSEEVECPEPQSVEPGMEVV